MTLTPAYGRDYKSKAAVLADFAANKDFVTHDRLTEALINKSQLEELHIHRVHIRYAHLRKVVVVTL